MDKHRYDPTKSLHDDDAFEWRLRRAARRSLISRTFSPVIPKRIRPAAIRLWNRITRIRRWKIPVMRDLEEIREQLRDLQYQILTVGPTRHQDMMIMLNNISAINRNPNIRLLTGHPVAIDSADHLYPRGTALDNTRSPRFCRACEAHFGRRISYLDLGCAGGGLVLDFLLRGHFAIGIEGSDFSLNAQRAEWRLIADHLFTADITKPFEILDNGSGHTKRFDVISAWETLEHIKEHDLEQLFWNVYDHLSSDGIFIGSICTRAASHGPTGTPYHVTVQKPDWWRKAMENYGLVPMPSQPFEFEDFCRGTEEGYVGFNFVVQKGSE